MTLSIRQRIAKLIGRRGYSGHGFRSITGGLVTVEVPEYGGRFTIDARSDLLKRILLSGEYEPEVSKSFAMLVSRFRGDFIDVGANVGFYSVLYGKLTGGTRHAIALEPVPAVYSLLRENVTANACSSMVTCVNAAASDRPGRLEITTVPGKSEYSSLAGRLVHRSVSTMDTVRVSVNTIQIDALVSESKIAPGVIKIDVEGAEVSVLRGGVETLRKFRPALVLEWDDAMGREFDTTFNQLIELLNTLRYKTLSCRGTSPGFVQHSGALLALPSERLSEAV